MRLFIAIETPREVSDYLKKVQDKLRCDAVRATYPLEFHLTLLFLGEVPDSQVEEIRQNLQKINFEKFSITLDKIGVFPNKDYIRVVWAGIKEAEIVEKLAREVEKVLGKEPDSRFHPHITLVRVKKLYDKKSFSKVVEGLTIEQRSYDVDSFKLIKSSLQKSGPVYEILEEYRGHCIKIS